MMYQGKVQDQELPGGYSARHLTMLTDTDAEEIHRVMMADETKVHGISVSDIRKATMGMEVPAEKMDKVESSIGRRHFAVSHPNCSKRKLMYTPMSHVRVHRERTDVTRILVPWIPQGAKVKAIGPEALYEDDTKDPEWLRKQHTHRGQLMALVHDMDEHPREGPSLQALKSVAFWPKMEADMSENWWTCADCLTEMKALKGIGTGIMALRRFTVLQLDHFKLPVAWTEMRGVHEILTITDSATRITPYEVVGG